MAVPRFAVSSSLISRSAADNCRKHTYVTLKLYVASPRANREILVYEHIRTVKARHAGQSNVRSLLDHFEIKSKYDERSHQCLIHPPLGMSLWQLIGLFPGRTSTEQLLKATLLNLFMALDYLHSEANFIHTGTSSLLNYADRNLCSYSSIYIDDVQIYNRIIFCWVSKTSPSSVNMRRWKSTILDRARLMVIALSTSLDLFHHRSEVQSYATSAKLDLEMKSMTRM